MFKIQLFLTIGLVLFSAISFGQDEKSWWKGLFSKEVNEKNREQKDESANPVISEPNRPDGSVNTSEQVDKNITGSSEVKGNINWVLPSNVELLNDSLTNHPNPVKGHRVVIYSGTLDAAKKFRAEFVFKYPEIPCYLRHSPPNFEVRIGNCREKSHAFELLSHYKTLFPGAYVTSDDIDFPMLNQLSESSEK